MSQHPAYTIGGLCLVGGTAAYLTKRSRPSLIAGTVCSLLYFGAGYLIQENRDWGHELAFATSMLLAGGMGARAFKSGKRVPSLVAVVGLFGAAYYGWKMYEYSS